MTSKQFHLGDVLSVTTHRLVSPSGINGIYAVLSFMAGRRVFTHELSDTADRMRPLLLQQHPWLLEVNVSTVTEDNWRDWLDAQVKAHGESLQIETEAKP